MQKLTPAGRRVLDVAAELFYGQGIHAVGVEAIAAGAGVTKKTLYACFGSKDQLVTAYLTERDQRWRDWLAGWGGDTAEERLLGTFDALDAWMDREDFRGCAFVNALAELPSADHPAHAVVLDQKRWMREHFADLAREAGAADPDDVAMSALLLYEGVTVAASSGIKGAAAQARKVVAGMLNGDAA